MKHKIYFPQLDVAHLLGVHRTIIWRRIVSRDTPEPRIIAEQKRLYKVDLFRAGMVFLEEQAMHSGNKNGRGEGMAITNVTPQVA